MILLSPLYFIFLLFFLCSFFSFLFFFSFFFKKKKLRVVIGIVLNNLAVLAAASYGHGKFDWASISPSKDLIYHDCFDGFKCARLIAPLDYKNDSDLRTVAIAMIKLLAVVSDDDPAFAGSVFSTLY